MEEVPVDKMLYLLFFITESFTELQQATVGAMITEWTKFGGMKAWMGKIGPHYEQSSNVFHAHKLKGDLMLTVGELDKNVDPASTLQVVDALVRANKKFEFFMIPGAGHGIERQIFIPRKRVDFFVRSLLRAELKN